MKRTSLRPRLVVTADGRGVVNHAVARMLVDLPDVTGLSAAVSEALAPLRQRDSGHSPGRVAVDLAVMLAEGGEAIADLTVLRNQPELFGSVASDATAWRVLNGIDAAALARIRVARARARELSWMQAAETGRLLSSTVGGFAIPGFVLDIDATIVLCHSEKEQAAKTWKKTWGYHPLLCFLDATGEALSGLLRAGNAGSNTAADHITVLDQSCSTATGGRMDRHAARSTSFTCSSRFGLTTHDHVKRSSTPVQDLEFGFARHDDDGQAGLVAELTGPLSPPGAWSYSNAGWCVLGRVIESVTGGSGKTPCGSICRTPSSTQPSGPRAHGMTSIHCGWRPCPAELPTGRRRTAGGYPWPPRTRPCR